MQLLPPQPGEHQLHPAPAELGEVLPDGRQRRREVRRLGQVVETDHAHVVRRIQAGDDVTAVFLANDQMALGLLAALHESGLEAPGDVSVVGFDDLPEAPYFTPPLTTVRQDFAELGRRGVQLVLARLRGEDLHPRPVPAQLIVRASTAPARARTIA